MKRYIKSAIISFDNLSKSELSDIISDPKADPDLLRDIIADTYEHSIRYDGTMILGLICNPNLSETDIPKEWVSDDLYQKSLVMDEDAPTWVLHKIFKENPRFLYSDGEPNIYMWDLVRNPNLPETDRQIILQQFPDMFEADTTYNFSLSYAEILSEDAYPFMLTKQHIESIIKEVINKHINLLNSNKCDVGFDTNYHTILGIDVFVPLILIKRNAQMLGEALVEALAEAGYEVEDWEWDEV